jgi:predicted nucleic acid-binding Zn ribbon protein
MPAYDFRCDTCKKVHELRMKISEYYEQKDALYCRHQDAEKPGCPGKLKRMVDCSATFELKGSGWFGKDGEGTGYEITQNEMDRNLESSARDEDTMRKFMDESAKYEEGE